MNEIDKGTRKGWSPIVSAGMAALIFGASYTIASSFDEYNRQSWYFIGVIMGAAFAFAFSAAINWLVFMIVRKLHKKGTNEAAFRTGIFVLNIVGGATFSLIW